MQSINGSTGGGSPVHSDFPFPIIKLPQENGGIKAKVTSHQIGNSGYIEGERGVGDISKDQYGSMNGRSAGIEVTLNDIYSPSKSHDLKGRTFRDGHPNRGGAHNQPGPANKIGEY